MGERWIGAAGRAEVEPRDRRDDVGLLVLFLLWSRWEGARSPGPEIVAPALGAQQPTALPGVRQTGNGTGSDLDRARNACHEGLAAAEGARRGRFDDGGG